jgi:hypothetical protein
MFGLAVGLPLLAIAILWSMVLRWQDRRRERRLHDAASADLDATGLSWSGDPLDAPTLSGRVHGVDVVLENGSSHARPGVQEHSELSCLVRVQARLEDQIVCRASDVDAVMGPLPSAPRRKAGHELFDAAYAAFGGETPWARPALLDGMRDLAMLWLRSRDGQCELAFPPLGARDLARAVTVAANVARVSWGEPAVDMRRGPIEPFRPQRRWGGFGAGVEVVWVIGGFTGGLSGCLFGDILLLDPDSPYECDPGARLERDSNGDGSWSGVSCSQGHDSFHGVHHLGSAVLGVAVVALFGFAMMTMKRIQQS